MPSHVAYRVPWMRTHDPASAASDEPSSAAERPPSPGSRMADRFGHRPDKEDTGIRRPMSRSEWEQLPPDPDLVADLGYELLDLEAYRTDGDHVLFLPPDEEMLQDEAFIVVGRDDVRSFGE